MRGNNVWRLAALALLCLAAAPAAVQAKSQTRLSVNVTAGLNTASFSIDATTGSKVVVSLGTSTQDMPDWHGVLPASREVNISPLAPHQKYYYRVSATNSAGKTSTASGSFPTSSWSGQPVLRVSGGHFYLNGVRYFPIMAMAFNECPSQQVVGADTAMGVDALYHSTWYGCPDENHDIQWTTADTLDGLLGGDVGWIQGGSRGGINPTQPPSWDSLPELVRQQGPFHIEGSPTHQVGSVPRNLSPFINCNITANDGADLYQSLAQEPAGRAVVYDTILTNMIGAAHRNCITAQRMSAAFWIPVLADAAGIEYQTQQYALPSDGVIVDGQVAASAGLQAKKLDTLYPVLFGGKRVAAASSKDSVKAAAWSWGGNTYVLALNLSPQTVSASIKSGNGRLKAKVMWEEGSVSVAGGNFSDSFAPFALHVYKLPN